MADTLVQSPRRTERRGETVAGLPAAQYLLDRALLILSGLLAKFPHAGRDFVIRNPASQKVAEAAEYVHTLLGADIELREYVLDGYLVLYAIQEQTVHLLAVRHHRLSGFNVGS